MCGFSGTNILEATRAKVGAQIELKEEAHPTDRGVARLFSVMISVSTNRVKKHSLLVILIFYLHLIFFSNHLVM
jgi:hypothetical protein